MPTPTFYFLMCWHIYRKFVRYDNVALLHQLTTLHQHDITTPYQYPVYTIQNSDPTSAGLPTKDLIIDFVLITEITNIVLSEIN